MNKIKTEEELRTMRKQMGVPFMSYFKKVMNELKNGRTDYENLLPATIQL